MSIDSKAECEEFVDDFSGNPVGPPDSIDAGSPFHECEPQRRSSSEAASSPSNDVCVAEGTFTCTNLGSPGGRRLLSEVGVVSSRNMSPSQCSSVDMQVVEVTKVLLQPQDLSETGEPADDAQMKYVHERSSGGSDVCAKTKGGDVAEAESDPNLHTIPLPMCFEENDVYVYSSGVFHSSPTSQEGFVADSVVTEPVSAAVGDMANSTTVGCSERDAEAEEHAAKDVRDPAAPSKGQHEHSINGGRPLRKSVRGRAAEATKPHQLPQRARTAVPSAVSNSEQKRIPDDPQHGRWSSACGISTADHITVSEVADGSHKGKSSDAIKKHSSRGGPMSHPNTTSGTEFYKGFVSADAGTSGDRVVPVQTVTHRPRRAKGRQTHLVEEGFVSFGSQLHGNMLSEPPQDSGPPNNQCTMERPVVMVGQKQQLLCPVQLQSDASKMMDIPAVPPHWTMLPSYYFVSSLEVYVDTCLGLRENERQERYGFVSRIQSITTKVLGPRARLRMHGSITTGLALASSDIDVLVVDYEPLAPLQAIQLLSKAIQSISEEELERLNSEQAEQCPPGASDAHESGYSSNLGGGTDEVAAENNVVEVPGVVVDDNMFVSAGDSLEPDSILRVEEEEAEVRLQIERAYAVSTRVGSNATALALHGCIPPFTTTPPPTIPAGGRRRLYVPTVDGPLYQVQTIISTRVPVIKVMEKMTGLRCDISFAGGEHWRSMELTNRLLARYPASRGLILFLKHCVRHMGIGDSQPGDITSFAIYLLVHHFFNEISRHLEGMLKERIQQQQLMERGTQPQGRDLYDLESRSCAGGGGSPSLPSQCLHPSSSTNHGSGVTPPVDQKASNIDDRFPLVTGTFVGQFFSQQQQSNRQSSNAWQTTKDMLRSILLFWDNVDGHSTDVDVGNVQLSSESNASPNQIVETVGEWQQQQDAEVMEDAAAAGGDVAINRLCEERGLEQGPIELSDDGGDGCRDDGGDGSAGSELGCPELAAVVDSFGSSGAVGDDVATEQHGSGEEGTHLQAATQEGAKEVVNEGVDENAGATSQDELSQEDELVRSIVYRLLVTASLGNLFHDFCHYYGYSFNYDTQGLRFEPDGSSTVVPKPQQCQQRGQHLFMTSPFDEQYDITAHMTHTRALQELCGMFVPLTNPLPVANGDDSNVCSLRQVLEWISPDTAPKELLDVHNALQRQAQQHREVRQATDVKVQTAMDGDRCGTFSSSRGRVSVGTDERSTSPSQLNFAEDGNELSSGGRSFRPRGQTQLPKECKIAVAISGHRLANDLTPAVAVLSRGGKGLPSNGCYSTELKGRSSQAAGWRQCKRADGDSEDVVAEARIAHRPPTPPNSESSSVMDTEANAAAAPPIPNAPLGSTSKAGKAIPGMIDVSAGSCDPSYMQAPAHAAVLSGQQQMAFGANPSLSMFMFPANSAGSLYPGLPQYYHPVPYTTEAQLHFRPDAYQQHPMAPFLYQGYDMNQMLQPRVMGEPQGDGVTNNNNAVVGKRQLGAYASSSGGHNQGSMRPGVSGCFLSRGRGRNSQRSTGGNNSGVEKVSQYRAVHSDSVEEQVPTPLVPSSSASAERSAPATFGGVTNNGVNRDTIPGVSVGTASGKEHHQSPQCYAAETQERLKMEGSSHGNEYLHHYSHQAQRQGAYPHNQQGVIPQHYHHHIQSSPKMRSSPQQQAQCHWRHQRAPMMMVPSPVCPAVTGVDGSVAVSASSPSQAGSSFQKSSTSAGSVFSSASQGATGSSGVSVGGGVGMSDGSKMVPLCADGHHQHSYHHHHHHFIHHNVHIPQRWQQSPRRLQRVEGSNTGVGAGAKGSGSLPLVATSDADGTCEEVPTEKNHQ